MRVIEVQLSEWTDHLTDEGQELTKLPYPFFVDASGAVGRQDFWNGIVHRVIGFQRNIAVDAVDLGWAEAYEDPSSAIGMYVITSDHSGNWSTHLTAVKSMNELGSRQSGSETAGTGHEG
jgi:hypothetical protein